MNDKAASFLFIPVAPVSRYYSTMVEYVVNALAF